MASKLSEDDVPGRGGNGARLKRRLLRRPVDGLARLDLAHLHRDLVAVDGVVGQQRQGELAALAGPQDARRAARRPPPGPGRLDEKLFGSSGVLKKTLELVDEMFSSGATMSLLVGFE